MKIPAGTWVICTGGFDNSENIPQNPDPRKRVGFGLQTWDEMFMGFLIVADLPLEASNGPSGHPAATAPTRR